MSYWRFFNSSIVFTNKLCYFLYSYMWYQLFIIWYWLWCLILLCASSIKKSNENVHKSNRYMLGSNKFFLKNHILQIPGTKVSFCCYKKVYIERLFRGETLIYIYVYIDSQFVWFDIWWILSIAEIWISKRPKSVPRHHSTLSIYHISTIFIYMESMYLYLSYYIIN